MGEDGHAAALVFPHHPLHGSGDPVVQLGHAFTAVRVGAAHVGHPDVVALGVGGGDGIKGHALPFSGEDLPEGRFGNDGQPVHGRRGGRRVHAAHKVAGIDAGDGLAAQKFGGAAGLFHSKGGEGRVQLAGEPPGQVDLALAVANADEGRHIGTSFSFGFVSVCPEKPPYAVRPYTSATAWAISPASAQMVSGSAQAAYSAALVRKPVSSSTAGQRSVRVT